jgi:integrin beta 3
MFDGQQLGEDVVGIVRGFMEREIAPLKAANEALQARVAELEARPAPEVLKGDPGEPGQPGSDGTDGKDGSDGRGVKELLIDREGNLIATMDNGEMKSLGPVVGKDGKRGKDGNDGLGFDDLDVNVLDDDRTIELAFRKGDEEKAFTFKWPTVIYRGVFKSGDTYEAGDAVTWGGHMWIAERSTAAKPDAPNEGWRLAVKRGRDGKDAK